MKPGLRTNLHFLLDATEDRTGQFYAGKLALAKDKGKRIPKPRASKKKRGR